MGEFKNKLLDGSKVELHPAGGEPYNYSVSCFSGELFFCELAVEWSSFISALICFLSSHADPSEKVPAAPQPPGVACCEISIDNQVVLVIKLSDIFWLRRC